MFSALESTDFNLVVTEKANVLIKKDRMRFSEVYRTVGEYCKNNGIIISDIHTLLDKNKDKDFKYELYCEFAFKHATNLSNAIHGNVGEWAKMKTVVGHQEFAIEYDMRPLVELHNLNRPKNIDLHALIIPVKKDDLFYMSPEIEIIDIYHKLYSPNYAEEWEDLVSVEDELFKLINKRMTDGVFGGGKPSPQDKTDFQYLKYLVLSEFCSEFVKDYVVIGHWAVHVMDASKDAEAKMNSSVEKLQLITSTDIRKSLEDIKNFLGKYTNAKISSRRQDLHIPKDFRTTRYTVYISMPGRGGESKDRAFMDVFDCGTFELIPYVPVSLSATYADVRKEHKFQDRSRSPGRHKGRRNNSRSPGRHKGRRRGGKEFIIKIGNPFVLLRFLMIDLWIVRMIAEMGHFNNEMLKTKTKYIIYVVEKIKNPEFGLIDKVFGTDYVGVYKDYIISKKRNNMKGRMFYPYYPEREILNNKAYRVV